MLTRAGPMPRASTLPDPWQLIAGLSPYWRQVNIDCGPSSLLTESNDRACQVSALQHADQRKNERRHLQQ